MVAEAKVKLINVQQVAAMLGVCEKTIDRWRKAGKLPSPIVYTGRSCYWAESQIEKWIQKR